MKYNPWPLGQLPKEFQRHELDQARDLGYDIKDARDAIYLFESTIAEFAGARHAVAVDCCTHALFLSLKYCQCIMECDNHNDIIGVPNHTYLSVPMTIMQAGYELRWSEQKWEGQYELAPLSIFDAAGRFTKDMHKSVPGSLQCLSFQIKKRLPIGRGGMVLTNDSVAAEWIRRVSYDGRDLNIPYDQDLPPLPGYHFYMTPEDAARGLILFKMLTKDGEETKFTDILSHENYTDLSKYGVFK